MPALPESDTTIGQVRRDIAVRLAAVSETPDLDSELLIRGVLGLDRAGLFLREPEPIDDESERRLVDLVERRLAGEPIAYILHRAPFRRVVLYVDDRVLVPRPETEDLVRLAIEWLSRQAGRRRVLDIGTGSGAIALSLAYELADRPEVDVVATDISAGALQVASINRERLGLTGRVRLLRTHLLEGVDGPFDLILANLPYLRQDQRHASTVHEPDVALYSGDDGFDLYREFFRTVGDRLAPGGLVIAEIDPSQAEFGSEYVAGITSLPVTVAVDSSGRERFLLAGSWA
jgi:release factor glutamine methyltransferase